MTLVELLMVCVAVIGVIAIWRVRNWIVSSILCVMAAILLGAYCASTGKFTLWHVSIATAILVGLVTLALIVLGAMMVSFIGAVDYVDQHDRPAIDLEHGYGDEGGAPVQQVRTKDKAA